MTDRVRIGLVGCGLFGESHLLAYQSIETAQVAAIFDPDSQRAKDMARAFGNPAICSSLEDLCARDIDAVDVVSPEATHLQPVLQAIRAGKHVFVEKPLATDLDECQQMIDAARDASRILMAGMILRFETKYALLKEEIEQRRLGNVVSMHARRNRRKSLLPRYGRTHPVLENAIHDIDLMLWYVGRRITRVRGYGRHATGGTHPDTFWGVLEFEGGALGVVETIWLLPDQGGVMLDDAFHIVGERGTGNLSLFPSSLTLWREDGFEVPDIAYDPRLRGAAHGALREELSYFCSCVRHGRQPEVIKPVEAKNSVRVALALISSASTGQDVVLENWD